MPKRIKQHRPIGAPARKQDGHGQWKNKRYGRRWRKVREVKLRIDPLCEWPGCDRPATEVHHEVKTRDGGGDGTLKSTCKMHHAEFERLAEKMDNHTQ